MLKEEADGTVRVSLRSLGDVDVQRDRRGARRRRAPVRRRLHVRRRHRRRRSTRIRARSDRRAVRAGRPRDRRPASSSTSRGLDVARRRREAAQGLRAAPRRARGHARPRRHRRAARRARARRPGCCASCRRPTKAYRGAIVFGVATDTLDAAGRGARPAADAGRPSRRRARAIAALRRRHRAGAADGVGGEGRRPPAPRARARGRGGRARAASGAHRPLRARGVRARPVPGGDGARRVRRAAPTSGRSPPTSAPRSAGSRTSASLRRLRVGSFTLDEAHPLDAIEADPAAAVLAAGRRDARPRAGRRRRRAGAARSRHGVGRSRRARSPCDGRRARSRVVGPDGDAARGLRAARRGAASRRSCSPPTTTADA